jgi:predicted nucleic acid-binding protein
LITGTLGVLEQAATSGFLSLSEALKNLSKTNFRISADVVRELLERDAGRRKAGSGSSSTQSG